MKLRRILQKIWKLKYTTGYLLMTVIAILVVRGIFFNQPSEKVETPVVSVVKVSSQNKPVTLKLPTSVPTTAPTTVPTVREISPTATPTVPSTTIENTNETGSSPFDMLKVPVLNLGIAPNDPCNTYFSTYTVEKGDTIASITQRFGLKSVIQLMSPNNLRGDVKVGQVLQIPPTQHVVEEGETVKSIADQYNINVECVVKANSLGPEGIKPGQELLIRPKV